MNYTLSVRYPKKQTSVITPESSRLVVAVNVACDTRDATLTKSFGRQSVTWLGRRHTASIA